MRIRVTKGGVQRGEQGKVRGGQVPVESMTTRSSVSRQGVIQAESTLTSSTASVTSPVSHSVAITKNKARPERRERPSLNSRRQQLIYCILSKDWGTKDG